MSEQTIYLAIAAFFFIFSLSYIALRLPALLRSLTVGRAWRLAFPKMREEDIHYFLTLLGNALEMGALRRLRVHPGDTLYGLYREQHPKRVVPDTNELEVLADELYHYYGIDLAEFWSHRLSLGELFAASHRELRRR